MQAKKEYNLGLKPPSWNPHIPVMAMGSAPKFAATGTEPRLAADGNGNDWVDNPLGELRGLELVSKRQGGGASGNPSN